MIGDQISDEICANKTGIKFMNINDINLKIKKDIKLIIINKILMGFIDFN